MSREIFKKFIGGVLEGMDKALAANFKEIEKEMEKHVSERIHVQLKRFEWKSLGYVGAKGVAEHLKEKHHLLETPPTVVVEEDGKKPKTSSVFSVSHEKWRHEFWVGESRYRYVRLNGKSKEMFKDFSALRTEFWRDFGKRHAKIAKRSKAKATKEREDASYERSLQIQREKEAQEKENSANPPQETPLPSPETGEAGDDSASEK